ncbi:MAG: 16S rRNA (guanine(966)-N(2))-methyltransferase RsmD [Beggiatoa sp. IS2]|nr:MAG: 16S rRNA (guanine(966)-N(2))-methyltransferase RsmD [Beggiatoa sp. IS2]
MSGQIRIIGGQWRRRKLPVPNVTGLRPTPDRVRETVFNWLTNDLPNSRCLDLFAGTGALGIEAASRGAKSVLLVEKKFPVYQQLIQQCTQLAAEQIEVICMDALQFLKGTAPPFDIVFLDPPFGQNLLQPCCILLEQKQWLNTPAFIYLEAERTLKQPVLPATWQIIRQQQAGQVVFSLALRN